MAINALECAVLLDSTRAEVESQFSPLNCKSSQCTYSTPTVHLQYTYSAPTLHLHYSTCLAPDRAPVGKDNARAAGRDALPDVHEHLLGRLRDERAHEGAPVAHDRAARRVAGVAAVTLQGSVIASSPLYQVYQLQSFKSNSQCPQCMYVKGN